MTELPRIEVLRSHLAGSDSPYLKRELARQIQGELLRDQIRACTKCPLHKTRIQAVPIDGPTHAKPDLIVVGEAPGAYEDKYGTPFVGRSGMLLADCLEAAGTKRTRVAVMNTLACRPPDNRDPEKGELAACRPWFEKQLSITKTWIGVALGGYALANVMGVARSSISIRDYLDKPIWVDGRVWFGTFHPSYALRTIGAKSEIILSIKAALALRFGKNGLPPFSTIKNEAEHRKEEIDRMNELDLLGTGRTDLIKKLQKFGWTFAYSKALDAKILIIMGERAIKKPIPSSLSSYPMYTLEELIRIGEAGAGRGGWTRADMRRLHMVKVEFGGEVIS